MTPHFADARCITSGVESLREGYDPLVNNVRDPWLRPMNYPRVWLLLVWLGVDQRHTSVLGGMFIAAFLAGLILLAPGADARGIGLLAICTFSPAVLFGVERANNDLFMFFLLAVAVSVVERSRAGSLALVGTGALLKIYPFFGVALALRAPRKVAVRQLAVAVALMLLYAAITFRDMHAIREATPQSVRLAYGVNVFWMSFRTHFSNPAVSWVLAIASYGTLLTAGVACVEWGRYTYRHAGPVASGRLDFFRVGSAVYLGSFVLFTNWDYRLMFLIFTLPALSDWARRDQHPIRWVARIALGSEALACWSLGLRAVARHVPHALPVWFLLDQAVKWTVFVALLAVFACTLPEWLYPRAWHRGEPVTA